jgi:hypothetical protein
MSVSTLPFGDDWLVAYFHMADRLDPEEFVTWYTPDSVFRSGNLPPVTGRTAIIAALTSFYSVVSSMRHERTGSWTDHNSGVFEAIAHFTTKDGRTLALPAITSLRLTGNKVSRLLFVMDATPLFNPSSGG